MNERRVSAKGGAARFVGLVAVATALATIGVSAVLGAGCSKKKEDAATADVPPVTLTVTESSPGLLLTWIDDKGDFHVEQKVGDVPLEGRDAVRVVDPTRDEGTHDDRVLVADLRVARPDGTFAVKPMTRAEFDALALARREKKGVTLTNSEAPPAGPAQGRGAPVDQVDEGKGAPGEATRGGAPSDGTPAGRPAVIIYGASWCSACHDAAAYLRKKGIAFVEKDIEQDARAAQEMKGKLARTGLPAGSIPVLDVRGRVMVGFNAREVDEALGQAL